MRRRDFLRLLSGAPVAWVLTAHSQQRAIPIIGVLGPQPNSVPFGDAITAGLRELGYVEGQNILIEARWANGRFRVSAKISGRAGPP